MIFVLAPYVQIWNPDTFAELKCDCCVYFPENVIGCLPAYLWPFFLKGAPSAQLSIVVEHSFALCFFKAKYGYVSEQFS